MDYLLKQFRDGEIVTQADFSPSQRQALDALCVYALSHAGQAISDRRIDHNSKELAQMLDKLDAYDLTSDGKVLNRPIVYGRSLRAAALALNNHPKDVNVLKADVKWLIASQLSGAYSYDDTAIDMLRAGVKPMSERIGGEDADNLATSPFLLVQDDFGGGSGGPSFGSGPYGPPMSPLPPGPGVPLLPGGPASPTPPGGMQPPVDSGPGMKQIERPNAMNNRQRAWYPDPRPTANFPRPYANFPRPVFPMLTPNYPKPQKPIPGGTGRMGSNAGTALPYGPVGDNQVPKADIRIEFPWDNSNSQYGLLGVWAGAEVGMEVPDEYWQSVEQHWVSTQFKTGSGLTRKMTPPGIFRCPARASRPCW